MCKVEQDSNCTFNAVQDPIIAFFFKLVSFHEKDDGVYHATIWVPISLAVLMMTGIYRLTQGRLIHRRCGFHPCLFHKNKIKSLHAVALPTQPPLVDEVEQRKQMCESYGFTQIGEPLPETVTLKDVIDTLPKKVQ